MRRRLPILLVTHFETSLQFEFLGNENFNAMKGGKWFRSCLCIVFNDECYILFKFYSTGIEQFENSHPNSVTAFQPEDKGDFLQFFHYVEDFRRISHRKMTNFMSSWDSIVQISGQALHFARKPQWNGAWDCYLRKNFCPLSKLLTFRVLWWLCIK